MPTPVHVKIAQLEARLTNQALAEKLGVTEQHLCHVLSGRRRLLPDTGARLARLLKRPVGELFPQLSE